MSVELVDVSVSFADRPVLRHVQLRVGDGEIVGLLGASGSGKSTLLRVVAGLQRLDHGSVLVDGVDVTNVPTYLRNIGLIFQDQALFPHLDVAGNIAFGLQLRHGAALPKAQRTKRVNELLKLVGLDGFGPRKINSLSGGEAQRVAVARALAPRPRVLLLDEPFSALDAELRARLAKELRMILRHEGTTAIHVTHDVNEANAIGDRTLRLSDLNQPTV
jgi:thiamine transport system ATP-binding protein